MNQLIQRMLFAFVVTCGLIEHYAWAQSPLPKVMEHSYAEFKEQFDAWQIPPGDHPEEVLLEEIRLKYDERGASTQSIRRVWRLKSKQVSDYGIIAREYAPWYENQPTITARVFDSTGREFLLSKDDITLSPAGSREQGVLTDRMVMQAALPGLKVGAIVEEIVEVTERDPFCEHGTAERYSLDSLYPALFFSIEIDAPETLPIDVLFRPRQPAELQQELHVADGRRNQRWFTGQRTVVPIQSFEADVPRDVYQQQSIVINTGTQWRSIAEHYSKLVNNRLESEPLDEIAREVLSTGSDEDVTTIEGKLHRCSQWIQQNIRYTGIQLGNAAIVPARPTTVVSRRFGDCKDQAALLVGLLRATGIEADVALVNATTARFPSPDVPCLNAFNHAIVVVRHPAGDLWVDPTYPGSTPRCIPDYLQGRFALIANPNVDALTTIPSQGTEGNRDQEIRTISITASGNATIQSEAILSGYFAADARSNALRQTIEEEAKILGEHYVKAGVSAQVLLQDRSDPELDESTFHRKTELRDLPLEQADGNRFRLDLTFRGAISNCPYFHLIEKTERGANKPRRHPAECIVPYRWSRACTLIPPNGYQIATQTRDHTIQIGGIELISTLKHLEDGSLLVEQSLQVQSERFSPEDLDKLSNLALQLDASDHPLNFSALVESETATDSVNRSALIQQLDSLRHQWLTEPSGDSGYNYVASLVAVGQVEEARDVALTMIERLPEEGMAYCAHAYALLHDVVGRELGFGCEVRRAETACRKAIELSPHRWQPYYLLSILLDVDDQGVHKNDPQSFRGQLDVLEAAESKGIQEERLIERKIIAMIRLNRLDDAISLATKSGLEQYLNVAKAVKAAHASRWGDIAAIRERIPSSTEREIVGSIAEQLLLSERDYEKGARIVYTLRGMSDRDIEERVRAGVKIETVDRPQDPTRSPETVAREFLLRIIAQGNHPEVWSDIVANSGTECQTTELIAICTDALRTKTTKVKACIDRLYDTCCLYPLRIDGDDTLGHMARIKMRVDCDLAVIKQGDQYKVLLTGPNQRDYALHAQKLLDDGMPELAIRWMDWMLKTQPEGVMLNPETGNPVKRYWTASRKKTPEAIRTAIEMQLAASEWTPERSRILHEAVAAEKSAVKRQWIQLSFLMNSNLQGSELESELKSYLEQFPGSAFAKDRWANYQAEQGNIEPMKEYIRETNNVNDPTRIRYVDRIRYFEKDYVAMCEERFARAADSKSADLWNSCIWAGLFAENIEEVWLEDLRGVMKLSPEEEALHTLACAEVHVGDVDRAVGHLRLLVDTQANCIRNVDYWILGRIAEQCQLPERARSYYSRIKPTKKLGTTYELAQRRIAELDQQSNLSDALTSPAEPNATVSP